MKMPNGNVRFTTEQRLATLERESVILHDTTRLLHQMLKEQRGLINDYIIQMVAAPEQGTYRPQQRSSDSLEHLHRQAAVR